MSAPATGRIVKSARGPLVAVTLIFVILGLALASVMTFYRRQVLEPRLRDEAMAQAEILSRSQAGPIALALRSGDGDSRRRNLDVALDELLLLRDPTSAEPYFSSVVLEIDHDAVGAREGTLNLRKGDLSSASSFPTSVALYDAKTSEVLGLAKFGVSNRLFRELSGRVGDELFRVTLAVLALLFILWAVLATVLAQLAGQTEKRFVAERELTQAEQRYERLANNLNQYFVYRKDTQGRLLNVSDSVVRVLGFSAEEFATRHAESLRAASESLESHPTFEVGLEDIHGQTHRIELSEVAVLDDRGTLVAFDGIARDATTERRFREELQHAKDEAEAASRAKSHFLANMSHEIRTPLNAILGMAGLALRSVRDSRDRAYLEKIRTSARLLAEIVEDVLDLSRIEAGRLELANEPFDLEDMLAEISDVIGAKAGARSLEVLFRPEGRLPRRLIGDVVRLKQILLNLLNNAVKFTERGEIVARIEAVEVRRDRAALRFTVTDTGIGIAAPHLPTLFEPFTQVDSSNTRRYGGMGLGLAISRRLVRLMDGEISVSSEVGVGSTFTFTAAFGLPGDGPDERRLPESLQGMHALVVDDNESARVALSGMLEMLSCRVDAVSSGEEATSLFEKASASHPYRIALIDWKMPGIDGIETASRLKKLAGRSPLGVILVTAYDWEKAARRADEAGIATVLHKPLSPSSLHDALVTTLTPGERLRSPTPGTIPTNFAPGQTVLLVEDQAINRELARELLAQAGLTVFEERNGREALAFLENRRPDVVLMDVQMPDMDGLAAVQSIRANGKLVSLPVVAMTAHAMLGDRERFLKGGMSDYVPKPIEEAQLFRVLGRWLKAGAVAVWSPNPSMQAVSADSSPTSSSDMVLDRAAGLRRTGGNQDLYERLLKGFVQEAPDLLSKLNEAVVRGDHDAAHRLLHTLKGNAATVNAVEVARIAAALEKVNELPTVATFRELTGAMTRLVAVVSASSIVAASSEPSVNIAPSSLTDAQRAEALAQLQRLADHVASGNLAARRSFVELGRALNGAFPEIMEAMADSMSRLDFAAVAPQIDRLRADLSSSRKSA